MEHLLHDMEESLIRYCEVISQVIDAAVTVVDSRQIRIIYHGNRWKFHAGVSMAEKGNIVRMTIESRETQVMLETRNHPACMQCQNKDKCKENVEVWAPIMVSNTCVGAIGFVCETKRQEQRIRKNIKDYVTFLEQIAGLISYEATQHMASQQQNELIELMSTVVEQVDSGVIVLGQDNIVLKTNQSGRRILQNMMPDLDVASIRLRPTEKEGQYEIVDQIRSCTVTGRLYAVHAGPFQQVLIFQNEEYYRQLTQHRMPFSQITGTSKAIQNVRDRIKNVADSPSSVLILAESGLGKEIFARAIHDAGERWNKPFIRIDCTDLAESDAEKYLFGMTTISNVPGSRGKAGRIEEAAEGTLFLDNVSSLPLSIQRKLVRLLEKREIVRVGSKRPRKLNVRVIASTNQDLVPMCEEGNFLKDLYYLLNVIPIPIPPLRERREDIRPLAIHFIQLFSRELDKPVAEVQDSFWHSVEHYDWPGNIRELRSAMEYAINMMDYPNCISAELLPAKIHPRKPVLSIEPSTINLEDVERGVICCALQLQKEQKLTNEQIANMLGIGTTTFYRKLKNFGLK